jgi:hypothetical protein
VRLGSPEALFFWDLAATAPLNYFRRPLSFGDSAPNLIRWNLKGWLLVWPEACSSSSLRPSVCHGWHSPKQTRRWSARLKVESELLTSAANAIVKT